MDETAAEKDLIMIKKYHEGGTSQIRPEYRQGGGRNFSNLKLSRNERLRVK
jgi:hypothetical protein